MFYFCYNDNSTLFYEVDNVILLKFRRFQFYLQFLFIVLVNGTNFIDGTVKYNWIHIVAYLIIFYLSNKYNFYIDIVFHKTNFIPFLLYFLNLFNKIN